MLGNVNVKPRNNARTVASVDALISGAKSTSSSINSCDGGRCDNSRCLRRCFSSYKVAHNASDKFTLGVAFHREEEGENKQNTTCHLMRFVLDDARRDVRRQRRDIAAAILQQRLQSRKRMLSSSHVIEAL